MRSMNFLLITVFMIVIFMPSVILADDPNIDDGILVLDDHKAIELAFQNNDLIEAAQRMVKAAIADGRSQAAAFDPQLTTTYTYTRLDKAPSASFDMGEGPMTIPMGTKDNFEWGLTLIVPVYAGGAKPAINKMVGVNADLSRNSLDIARQGISYGVTEAYFGVLSTSHLVRVHESTVRFLDKSLSNARKWQQEGYFLPTQALQMEVAQGKAQIELQKAIDLRESALMSLKQIIGVDSELEIEMIEPLTPPELKEIEKSGLFSIAESANPEVKAINLQLKMLKLQKRLAVSAQRPSLNLVSNYMRSGDDFTVSGDGLGGDSDMFSATLQLSWSIFDSRKTSHQKRQLDESINALELQRKDTLEKLQISLQSALRDCLRSLDSIDVTRKNLLAAKENFQILESRFTEGMETSANLLEAETLLSGAKLEYNQSIYDSHRYLAKLAMIAGYETPDDFMGALSGNYRGE